ncbi:hypothetical protein H671_1g0087 [Cricetulus griseus]|nr:hypothetical protein H671_1g0087 [Cricetulus griseus]
MPVNSWTRACNGTITQLSKTIHNLRGLRSSSLSVSFCPLLQIWTTGNNCHLGGRRGGNKKREELGGCCSHCLQLPGSSCSLAFSSIAKSVPGGQGSCVSRLHYFLGICKCSVNSRRVEMNE